MYLNSMESRWQETCLSKYLYTAKNVNSEKSEITLLGLGIMMYGWKIFLVPLGPLPKCFVRHLVCFIKYYLKRRKQLFSLFSDLWSCIRNCTRSQKTATTTRNIKLMPKFVKISEASNVILTYLYHIFMLYHILNIWYHLIWHTFAWLGH